MNSIMNSRPTMKERKRGYMHKHAKSVEGLESGN